MVEDEVLSVRKQLEKISAGEADNAQVYILEDLFFYLIYLFIYLLYRATHKGFDVPSGTDYSYGAISPLCNLLPPLPPPDHFSCILYMFSFLNHLEKIVDIYKSTKSRKVRSIS